MILTVAVSRETRERKDMTALAEAFRKAGGPSPVVVEFETQLSLLVERACSRQVGIGDIVAVLERAAHLLRGQGHICEAQSGHLPYADPAQYSFRGNPDGGHYRDARQGQAYVAADTSCAAGQLIRADNGQSLHATSQETQSRGMEGYWPAADKVPAPVPPPREIISQAASILRSVQLRGPGAGALQARAYETRERIRGESWILAHETSGGRVLELTFGAAASVLKNRTLSQAAKELFDAALLSRLIAEGQKLGRVSDHQIIGKTLPPAVIDQIAVEFEPATVLRKARRLMKENIGQLTGDSHAA